MSVRIQINDGCDDSVTQISAHRAVDSVADLGVALGDRTLAGGWYIWYDTLPVEKQHATRVNKMVPSRIVWVALSTNNQHLRTPQPANAMSKRISWNCLQQANKSPNVGRLWKISFLFG